MIRRILFRSAPRSCLREDTPNELRVTDVELHFFKIDGRFRWWCVARDHHGEGGGGRDLSHVCGWIIKEGGSWRLPNILWRRKMKMKIVWKMYMKRKNKRKKKMKEKSWKEEKKEWKKIKIKKIKEQKRKKRTEDVMESCKCSWKADAENVFGKATVKR